MTDRCARWGRLTLGVALTVALGVSPHAAHGEEAVGAPASEAPPTAAQVAALKVQVQQLHAQQLALEARLDASAARIPPHPPAEEPRAGHHSVSFSAAPGKGLTLSVGDLFSLSLRTRVQVRDTVFMRADQPTTNEINVRTIRLWLQGHMLTPDLQFGIQLAFGGADSDPGTPSPILDAYVDYLRLRDLKIRVGQFFVPMDRGRTTFEFALQLSERAQIFSELGLGRDVGIAFSSTDLFGSHGVLGYSLGLFGGEGKNHFGGGPAGFLYVARITLTPFGPFDDYLEGDLQRLRRPRLAIGVGGAYNQNAQRTLSTGGETLTLGTFDYGHAAADVVLKWAGFSLFGEVIYRQARQGSLTGLVNGQEVRQWSRSALGYVLQIGVMVHDRVELTARFDQLLPIGQTDPTLIAMAAVTGKELGGGINVFVYGHALKLQSDYQFLFGDSLDTGRHALRFQLDASF